LGYGIYNGCKCIKKKRAGGNVLGLGLCPWSRQKKYVNGDLETMGLIKVRGVGLDPSCMRG